MIVLTMAMAVTDPQVLAILDALDALDRDRTAAYVASLQRPDGAFMGDEWGEVDTRFVYCALNCLALLRRLPVRTAALAMCSTRTNLRPTLLYGRPGKGRPRWCKRERGEGRGVFNTMSQL